jgi:SSS family transporter
VVARVLACLAALISLLGQAPVRAESLPQLGTAALAVSPAADALWVSAGKQLLAIDAGHAWSWDGSAWRTMPWREASRPLAAASGLLREGAAVLVFAGDQGLRAARLRVDAGNALLDPLPPLPPGLQQPLATLHGQTLTLLARGSATMVLQLDLGKAGATWRELPAPPAGVSGGLALAVAGQAGGAMTAVWRGAAGEADRLWRYSADKGWVDHGPVPGRLQPLTLRATGQAHLMALVAPVTPPQGTSRWMTWQSITGSWAALPGDAPATLTHAAPSGDGIAWSDGSTATLTQIVTGKQLLTAFDWFVIAAYLASMLGIGLYFYLREQRLSTADFFVGSRSIPFWAAGVSLYATNTSSISYIAIPAKAFESNWTYMTNNLVAVLGLMFVAVWIVPMLRRLDLMSVFHYLEIRFHPAIRMLASALCILTQVGSRLSVVLFLPALAISAISGIDVIWSVLLMGGFTIAYTALGGMKAVIWTDCAQLVVMTGGAFFAIGFMALHIDGGTTAFIETANAANKMKLLDFSFDLTKATVWGFIFLVLFDVILTFPKDQVLMQRVLSTPSDKEAGRSIWAFAAIMVPGGFVFYGIGTALYVYYKAHPERMDPLLGVDATFPLFIAAELPAGMTGLIIAGIFAAAMSTLSSIINSVATLASVDFYEKLVKNPDPKTSVRFAEWMTVVVGVAGIGVALLLSRYDIQSLFDVSIELAGLLGGGFAGAYTLGMFTKRANSPGVAIGIGSAIVLTGWCWTLNLVHPYFYLAISILLCIVIGYVASLFFPAPGRSLKGLTIYGDAGPEQQEKAT